MIKIVTRKTNLINYCCGKNHKINKIDLLINNQRNYKSFDYYSDTFCEICGNNNLKFILL